MRRLTLEANEPVGIVFQHEQFVLPHELHEAVTALFAQRPAARVLEGWNRVEEGWFPAAVERLCKRIQVEALVVHVDRYRLNATRGENLQRAIVGRGLYDDAFAGKPLGKEDHSLERTVRDEDTRGVDAVTLRDPVPQRPVTRRRSV